MVRLFFAFIAGLGVGSVAFIVGLGVGSLLTYKLMTPIFEVRVNYQTLHFPAIGVTLHMTARTWGITGNHDEVRICDRPVDFNCSGCLVFYSPELFYRKDGTDELVVYVSSSAVPSDQPTRLGSVDVLVHELKTAEQFAKTEMSYEQGGLLRIYAP